MRLFEAGQEHVKVGTGEALHRGEHRPNWVLERRTVREHGVVITGPEPKTLIDPVAPDELRAAVGAELRARTTNWGDGSWPRRELAVVGAQAFEVETACRALLTLEIGELSTKREAVEWALASLPARWSGLIEWSQMHPKDPAVDEGRIPEVLEFLGWAAGETA